MKRIEFKFEIGDSVIDGKGDVGTIYQQFCDECGIGYRIAYKKELNYIVVSRRESELIVESGQIFIHEVTEEQYIKNSAMKGGQEKHLTHGSGVKNRTFPGALEKHPLIRKTPPPPVDE